MEKIILEIIKKEKTKDLSFFDLRTHTGSDQYAPGECEIEEVKIQTKEYFGKLTMTFSHWVPRECTKEIRDLFVDYIRLEPGVDQSAEEKRRNE